MAKYNSTILLTAIIGLAVIVSGCINSSEPTPRTQGVTPAVQTSSGLQVQLTEVKDLADCGYELVGGSAAKTIACTSVSIEFSNNGQESIDFILDRNAIVTNDGKQHSSISSTVISNYRLFPGARQNVNIRYDSLGKQDNPILYIGISIINAVQEKIERKEFKFDLTPHLPTIAIPPLTTTPTIPTTNESIVFLAEGERDGPLLVQKIYSDYIEGLNFREYPIATNKGTPINLSIGQAASNGCTITLTLISIENKTAKFSKKVEWNKPCPICLSGNTYIDTPDGSVQVKDLKVGMAVWTSDRGYKHAAIILRTSKVLVPKDFQMVYIALYDGRELLASPGHPLADGRILENIRGGDIVDNGTVVIAKRMPYEGAYTYDILPSGDTGLYWANGIPVRSTLESN